jgi:hypothetical protein
MVPEVADQVTAGFDEFVTRLVNCDTPEGCKAALDGVTVTATGADTVI